MKLKISKGFSVKLSKQVEFIAQDKPEAAIKFRNDLLNEFEMLQAFPYKHRQSIYAEDPNIRDLIFKGYTIVYRIKPQEDLIEVFGFLKFQKA